MSPLFHNRQEAGQRLAQVLAQRGETAPLILALARGGVPVAFEIAVALEAQLDVIVVRKLGLPGQEELAIGAVVEGEPPQVVLNHDVIERAGVSPAQVEAAKQAQMEALGRRRDLYRAGAAPAATRGRNVIIVDDGIATGATMKAALRAVRARGPNRVALAVPVAPADTIRDLAGECDKVICLVCPEPFGAVGLHYAHFGATTDEEVVNLLAKARLLPVSQGKDPAAG